HAPQNGRNYFGTCEPTTLARSLHTRWNRGLQFPCIVKVWAPRRMNCVGESGMFPHVWLERCAFWISRRSRRAAFTVIFRCVTARAPVMVTLPFGLIVTLYPAMFPPDCPKWMGDGRLAALAPQTKTAAIPATASRRPVRTAGG